MMPNEFKNASKYVTAVRREVKRNAEAVEREKANHATRLAEIEAEFALTPEERALAESVLKRNGAPPAATPEPPRLDFVAGAATDPVPVGPPRQARR